MSKQKVGTKEFAAAVIANLGQQPQQLPAVSYAGGKPIQLPRYQRKKPAKKEQMGIDLFVHWQDTNPDELANRMKELEVEEVKLSMITNRGIKVWPEGFEETFCTDHWRCRYQGQQGKFIKHDTITLLINALKHEIDVVKTENLLYAFDGKAAFSMGQGQ